MLRSRLESMSAAMVRATGAVAGAAELLAVLAPAPGLADTGDHSDQVQQLVRITDGALTPGVVMMRALESNELRARHFASLCRLQPGEYTYRVILYGATRGWIDSKGMAGRIVVNE
jgi:hypothetical protein